jgi:hypothetical protein
MVIAWLRMVAIRWETVTHLVPDLTKKKNSTN